jgi:spore coat protein U-like protein
MFKKIVISAIAVAALGTQAGHAGTATVSVGGGQLGVSATVNSSCTANQTTPVAFPAITSTVTAITATGTILVTCDPGVPFALGLGTGQWNPGGQRRMAAGFGATFLPYKLYVDAANTTEYTDILTGVSGSTTGSATASTPGGVGVAGGQTFSVYGVIAAGTPKPAPGNYNDNVNINVGY